MSDMPGQTTRVYQGDWIVSSMLVDRAEQFGEEIAIASEDSSASYADLVDRASRVGAFLADIGIDPGDRVATMLPTTLNYVAAWHGIVWRNAIDVPINNEFKGHFLEHIVRDSGARAIVMDAAWVDRLAQIELSDLEHVIVLGKLEADIPSNLAFHSFDSSLAADPGPLVSRDDTDPTYIMYTSGTTGPAKGAIHNNRSSIHYIMPFVEGLELTDDDVCYSMFPLFHQMGRSACSTAALWVGNRVALRSTFRVHGFWTDRIKDSIRRRGENISSFEVEASVRGESGVIECAAFAAISEIADTEEEVMIAVVPDPDGVPDVEVLFRRLCETMPRHAVPRYLRFVDELPKTPTQRVQKYKLREAGVIADTHDREAMGIFPPRS